MTGNALLGSLKSRIRGSSPYIALLQARGGFREARRIDRRVVTLEPTGPVRGDLLLSYTRGIRFLRGPEEQVPATHTHFRELRHMARTFLELGYRVDAITSDNRWFTPRKRYSVFVSHAGTCSGWPPWWAATACASCTSIRRTCSSRRRQSTPASWPCSDGGA